METLQSPEGLDTLGRNKGPEPLGDNGLDTRVGFKQPTVETVPNLAQFYFLSTSLKFNSIK